MIWLLAIAGLAVVGLCAVAVYRLGYWLGRTGK
jgi:hypothetical protein